jgi:hypothetical protein
VQVHDFRAGLRAWIDARDHKLPASLGDGIGQRLASTGTIPRLVEL